VGKPRALGERRRVRRFAPSARAEPGAGWLTMNPIKPRPLVLLVEDYEDTREMYLEYLTFCGFDVATARDGVEAIEKATAIRPDVILMDLSLPVMDGWEATRRLRSSPDTANLKIIALSAYPPSAASAHPVPGCDAFIAKPCLPADLVDALVAFLSQHAPTPVDVRRSRGPRA
jgi:two-component system cell cycle response regulator DivK